MNISNTVKMAEKLTPWKLMISKWFWSIGLFSLLSGLSGSVLAACDAELEAFLSAYKSEDPNNFAVYEKVFRNIHSAFLKGELKSDAFEPISILDKRIEDSKSALNKPPPGNMNPAFFRLNTIRHIKHAEYKKCVLQNPSKLPTTDNQALNQTQSRNTQQRTDQPQQPAQQNQSTQQQSQQAQQQAQQAQEAARVAQTRADQARQGQRRTHDPAAEAHQCIEIDKDPGLFGAFKNTCGYKVNFSTCNYRPRLRQGGFNWSADFDCEQQKFGLHTPDGGRAVASHNRNTETVHWFACKAPALPVDTEFVAGNGVRGRCN